MKFMLSSALSRLIFYCPNLRGNLTLRVNLLLLLFYLMVNPNIVYSQTNDPPDIIIRSIDTNIDPCNSISLMLTARTDITTGFAFNISTIDLEENSNTAFNWNNNIENVGIRYIGSDTIEFGDNLCIVIICQEDGGGISLSYDGQDISNDFELTSTHGTLLENIIREGRGVYLTRGSFIEIGGKTRLIGEVLDGLYLSSHEENLNQPYPLGVEESKIIPLGDGIFAYIQCVELDDCEPLKDITDKGNWESSIGTDHNDIDLEALCLEYCDFECNDTLTLLVDTLQLYYHTGCITPTRYYRNITNVSINGESMAENEQFNFPYCIWDNCDDAICSSGNCAISHLGNDIETYLESIGVDVFEIWYPMENVAGTFCLSILSEPVDIVLEAYHVTDDIKLLEPLDMGSPSYGLQLIPNLSCDIDSILWSDGTTLPFNNVNEFCDTIKVNIVCADGCEYDAFFVEPCEPKLSFTPEIESGNENFVIHPNPVSNTLHIRYKGSGQIQQLSLYSLEGQVIKNLNWSEGDKSSSLDVSSIHSGLYILQLTTTEFQYSKRVIITQ